MTIRIPKGPRQEIFDYVYAKADEHKYLEKSRPENTTFMENLGRDVQVGGRLEAYMDPANVKTYIKDTILNRYAKDRKTLPRSIEEILHPLYGETIEIDYRQQDHVSLHRVVSDNTLLAVSRTSDLKWETGLRKLIQYVAALISTATYPSLFPTINEHPTLTLIIFEYGSPINDADRSLVERGLEMLNVRCLWREL